MRIKKIDLWAPVWYIAGIVLCLTGQISWWVFILVVVSHFKIEIERK